MIKKLSSENPCTTPAPRLLSANIHLITLLNIALTLVITLEVPLINAGFSKTLFSQKTNTSLHSLLFDFPIQDDSFSEITSGLSLSDYQA